MNRKNVKFLALAGMMMALSCGSLLCGNGIVSYEGETDGLTSATAEITPLRACTSVEMPTLVPGDPEPHSFFMVYELKQEDEHATQMEFYTYPSLPSPSYTKQCAYGDTLRILGIPYVGATSCNVYPYYVKARCTTCNVASYSTTALIGVGPETIDYTPIVVKTSGMIYQNFDIGAPDAEWQHHAEKNETIYYSIAYNGFVVDDDVKVPGSWDFFPPKNDYTIDGVTFTVRVTSGYVSIKADETIACDNINTAFAFGTSN